MNVEDGFCPTPAGAPLEVGVGTGANLPHYPPDVQLTIWTRVHACSISPAFVPSDSGSTSKSGSRTLSSSTSPMTNFDTVTVTLVLSTVPDYRRAAAEIHRLLKPGGRLPILDHVRSPTAPVRWMQQMIEPLVASYAGWHFTRDPLDYIESTGFTVEHCDRTRLGMIEELVARKR